MTQKRLSTFSSLTQNLLPKKNDKHEEDRSGKSLTQNNENPQIINGRYSHMISLNNGLTPLTIDNKH